MEPDETEALMIFSKSYDFSESQHAWEHGFADYPANAEDSARFELKYAYTDQPAESILTKKSVMLSGNNVNGDLFMYLKKMINGLNPNTDYIITFNVELGYSCDPQSASGAGSVFLKVGASPVEPRSVIENGYYVMNVDKGDEDTPGEDVISLGDIATPEKSAGLVLLNRNNAMANSRYVATSNGDGELWLIIGTDSNLQGTTALFYTRVNVVFSAS